MKVISEFDGEFRFLSNFWPAKVTLGNMEFPSVEHAFQAAKTLNMQQRAAIRDCATPGQAKRMGRKVALRPDWESVKVDIMKQLVWAKFKNPTLRKMLLATGDALIEEGNNWNDRFWGICPPRSGNGLNHLGNILMKVRDHIAKP